MCSYLTFSLGGYNCVVRKLYRLTKSKLTIIYIEGHNMMNELKSRARRLIREQFIHTPMPHVITALSDDAMTEMCTTGSSIEEACTVVYDQFKVLTTSAAVKGASMKRALELMNRNARNQTLSRY